MNKLINDYKASCEMAKVRICELLSQRRHLRNNGAIKAIEQLDLNRRIQLLYAEYSDMAEIIVNLESKNHIRSIGGELI